MEFIKNIKRSIQKKMYAWHRVLGIITVIPTLAWTLSGIMHPFMAHFFKPTIANEFLKPTVVNANKIQWSLQQVLEKNRITEFKNFRIVSFNGATYYQVKINSAKYLYFNTQTGMLLKKGDEQYAVFLARFFLDDNKSAIEKIELKTNFDAQYKYVNRYLPVYKVTFSRPDAVEVYVETSSSKLATFNPTSRKIFIWIFDVFHNWGFLNWIANDVVRIVSMCLILGIVTLSALSGVVIYGFLWKKFKNPKATSATGVFRKYHRTIGIYVSFLTFTFGFSGFYHAIQKWEPNILPKMIIEPSVLVNQLPLNTKELFNQYKEITNIQLSQYHKQWYYVLTFKDQTKKWVSVTNHQLSKNLDIQYARELAEKFQKQINPSQTQLLKIKEVGVLTEFDKREYGFVNKRLPVVKIAYNDIDNTTYYIETSTGRLAAVVNNAKRAEGYSFAILHKFLLLEWAGKTTRDIALLIAAFGVFVVNLLGLLLFLKRK